jgi:anthranilate synthase/phosphoribosyltransferase
MDEISPCAPTDVIEIDETGAKKEYAIDPADFGIAGCAIDELLGGDSRENARLARDMLDGKGRRSILAAVALNAAATMYVSGKTATMKEGYDRAVAAIADGSVLRKLDEVREASCA